MNIIDIIYKVYYYLKVLQENLYVDNLEKWFEQLSILLFKITTK